MTAVLGIETSCDETGIAVVTDGFRLRANEVASQVDIHAAFGGVVPEIASRRHVECISQLAAKALSSAGTRIDAVAATCGPGLMGSLLVGVNFGKALAYAWRAPFVPVNHIEGHLFSAFFSDTPPRFPFLALVASGGHTCLIWSEAAHQYRLLGSTRDDAVGECFDKVARLLDLPYPGGPSIQTVAEKGDPSRHTFPRAMADSESLDFSYSGLKTAVLYELRDHGGKVEDVAAAFQEAAVDILVIKTKRAIQETGAHCLVVAGGVAANRVLRRRLNDELDLQVCMPPLEMCIDNGAMIAAAGFSRFAHGLVGDMRSTADPGLPLV